MGDKTIFSTYNQLKPIAEKKRLNKALAIAQTKSSDSKYHTTISGCTCADFMYRGGRCKHMLALMLKDPTLKVGDWVSPILFPEIAGAITEMNGDMCLVGESWYYTAELVRR